MTAETTKVVRPAYLALYVSFAGLVFNLTVVALLVHVFGIMTAIKIWGLAVLVGVVVGTVAWFGLPILVENLIDWRRRSKNKECRR